MGLSHRVFAASLLAALLLIPCAANADGFEEEQPMPASMALPEEIAGATWEWVWFGSGAEQFDVAEPARYTLQFADDGRAALQLDCNSGMTSYTLGEDQRISFGPIAATRMLCPDDSLDTRFAQALEQVAIYSLWEGGDLLLEAPADSGTLRFRRASGE